MLGAMRLILALAIVLGVGCKKTENEKVPTCAEVSAKLAAVTKIAYPGHGDMEMGSSKRDVEACEIRKPTAKERRCIMAAKDLAGVTACRKAALDQQPPPKSPAAPTKP
jgi:hypothetical protein